MKKAKRRGKKRTNNATPKRDSKGRFQKKRTNNPKKGKRKKNAWTGQRGRHSEAAKEGWAKPTHKTRKKLEAAGKTVKSQRTRTANPKRGKRRMNMDERSPNARRRYARKKNPITVTLDFTNVADALPATIAGTVGFIAPGVIDAVAGGKVSEAIAKIFAGKDSTGKERPLDYRAKAQGRAVLDVGMFFGTWFATSQIEMFQPYRTPALIGAGIRAVRSIFDAILDPKPDTISAGIRRVLALPSIQTKPLQLAAQIPGKLKIVSYDPAKKKYVDMAGAVVEIKFLPTGVATSTADEVLIDAESQQVLTQESSRALGSVYEEWDLVLSGAPEAGYEPNRLAAYEDWQETMAGEEDMGEYENWDETMGDHAPEAGYEPNRLADYEDWEEVPAGMGAYDDPYLSPF